MLKATGTRVLWWQAYGSSVFFSKGRDTKHPSQIRGQKIRVSGENYANLVKRCGGIPLGDPGRDHVDTAVLDRLMLL
jgi:C4-dicarboxylate-binding protein DctP